MNTAFRGYVTGQAFVLALSKSQIEALAWVAMNERQKDEYPTVPYGVTMDSLKRKGLVVLGPCRITEEGRLVLDLCKRAGLVGLVQPVKVAA